MAHLSVVLFIGLALFLAIAEGAPQFGGGFSQAQAQASAGNYGGGPRFNSGPRGGPGLGGPGFGSGAQFGPPRQNFGRPSGPARFGGSDGTVSISKSISITRGSGGTASSSASSSTGGK